jgi:hypothetical protein
VISYEHAIVMSLSLSLLLLLLLLVSLRESLLKNLLGTVMPDCTGSKRMMGTGGRAGD